MALGLSLSLGLIPGIGALLAKLDNLKTSYMAVPQRVSHALDALSQVQNAMARNSAPPSEQSAALTLRQHLQSIQSEWQASASAWASLDTERASGSLGLDSLSLATQLAANGAAVVSNMDSIESSVTTLAAKYLTTSEQQTVGMTAYGLGSSATTGALVVGGAVVLWLLMRKRS